MTLAKLFIKEIQGMIEMVHVKHELNIALSFKIIKWNKVCMRNGVEKIEFEKNKKWSNSIAAAAPPALLNILSCFEGKTGLSLKLKEIKLRKIAQKADHL